LIISSRNFAEAEHVATPPSAKRRKGFVIVEIIVAMVLLAIAISSLAALLYTISQSGMVATGNAYRNGALMSAVNTFEGLPYDSLKSQSNSTPTGPYPNTLTVTVTETVPAVVKYVKVVITPTNLKYKPDTVTFLRTNARTSKVLCQTCVDRP
jgi:type II secretory pathway pseudopilin PulG